MRYVEFWTGETEGDGEVLKVEGDVKVMDGKLFMVREDGELDEMMFGMVVMDEESVISEELMRSVVAVRWSEWM